MTFASVAHLVLHVITPAAVARIAFQSKWIKAWLFMLATMVVDLDHLFTNPIYDPSRCGIGFHPLHTTPAIALYSLMAILPPTRIVGVGLVIHMALDLLDCQFQ